MGLGTAPESLHCAACGQELFYVVRVEQFDWCVIHKNGNDAVAQDVIKVHMKNGRRDSTCDTLESLKDENEWLEVNWYPPLDSWNLDVRTIDFEPYEGLTQPLPDN